MSGLDVHQSVLAPAGVQASAIHSLWSLLLWVCVAVFIVVLAAVFIGVFRGTRNPAQEQREPRSEKGLSRTVGTAVGLSAIILLGLLTASVLTNRTMDALQASNAVTVGIIGHQWWWEIEYEDAIPSRRVVTANELHIPVNRPVVVKVTSRDVIHSFWVPNLQGKRDLIPGYTTALWVQADRAGVFRGQCAEFCGMQHAHMALEVIAQPEDEFNAWLNAMRQP